MPPLASIVTDLRESFDFVERTIADAHVTDSAGVFIHPLGFRSFIVEAAVVKLFVAWERYLEQSFLSYLMGFPSTRGTVVVKYLTAPTLEHTAKILVGTQKYVDWGNPEILVRLAGLHFEPADPFSVVIPNLLSDLFDLRAIRHAAAHLSTTTSAQLDAVALRRLKRPSVDATVYHLVTAEDPSAAPLTVLQSFRVQLSSAAEAIANF